MDETLTIDLDVDTLIEEALKKLPTSTPPKYDELSLMEKAVAVVCIHHTLHTVWNELNRRGVIKGGISITKAPDASDAKPNQ